MRLVRKSGSQCNLNQRFVRFQHSLPCMFDANFADIVTDGATLKPTKHASEMCRMHADCIRQLIEARRLSEILTQEFLDPLQPLGRLLIQAAVVLA